MENPIITKAKDHFGKLLEFQLKRMEAVKAGPDWVDYARLKPVRIGILAGDGIGPFIATEAKRVLEYLLHNEAQAGKIEIRDIEGLTIENRAAHRKAIPDDVLAEIKSFDVTLKGPTTTPRKGDPWPNIESCNVGLRKELDLFANVRPVRVPAQGIDWIFFRENTEDLYALGSSGIEVDDDIAIDFRLISAPGSDRICRLAFEHAKKNGRTRVTCVTKANVVKTTDGRFLENFYRIAKEYPGIAVDDWYIDIMTAKLIDEKRRRDFQVLVLPNLYGDILTDEAAELQGGVGTAGSANIGKRLRAPDGHRRPGPICRPLQHDPGRGDAGRPHRLPGNGPEARNGPGRVRPVREEADHHRTPERRDRQGLCRLRHGLDPEPETRGGLGRLHEELIPIAGSRPYRIKIISGGTS
jgi:isocitrate dehydrogenase (NAD+)